MLQLSPTNKNFTSLQKTWQNFGKLGGSVRNSNKYHGAAGMNSAKGKKRFPLTPCCRETTAPYLVKFNDWFFTNRKHFMTIARLQRTFSSDKFNIEF